MIRKCAKGDFQEMLDFIGDDHYRCPYLYLDMVTYGFEAPFVSMWRQNRADGSMAAVWLKYHSGMHVYAPHGYADVGEAADLVRSERPSMLCGVPEVLLPLEKHLEGDGYAFLGGTACRYDHPPKKLEPIDFRVAESEADFNRIGEMLYADSEYGASYKPGELASQLSERQRLGQGKSFVVEREGRIVSHMCIAVECERFTVLSSGVTDQSCRHDGLCSRLVFTVAEGLKNAGKESYSFYYNPVAAALHRKIGFVDTCAWGRLFLKMH